MTEDEFDRLIKKHIEGTAKIAASTYTSWDNPTKVERKSSYGSQDYLLGYPIKDGERVIVFWPDGKQLSTNVVVESSAESAGHGITIDNSTAFIELEHWGAKMKIRLYDSDLKLLRI